MEKGEGEREEGNGELSGGDGSISRRAALSFSPPFPSFSTRFSP